MDNIGELFFKIILITGIFVLAMVTMKEIDKINVRLTTIEDTITTMGK